MPFNNKLCILFIDLFSDLYKLAVMKILLLKQKTSVCASQTRSPCTHSKKEMETSNNGADRSAQSNSQRNESLCTSTQSIKEESSCTVYSRKRQSCEFTRPANEQTSQRVHVSSPTQTYKETDQALQTDRPLHLCAVTAQSEKEQP